MASPERKISAVPSGAPSQSSALDTRLASLEDEATRLRAEVAALQEDMRWLAGENEEEPGWLARGWVRASLLLATVGVVALVSLPYLLHLDASAPDPDRVRPAVIKAGPREHVPVPVRVPATEAPEPARIPSPVDPPLRAVREGRAAAPASDPVPVVAPVRDEGP
ncbi:MAG: hypothetical protein ACREKJ_12020 [Candidatus Rokuibacteriota bacterium]